MNLASIILVLQMAVALLATPGMSASQLQQARMFAGEAVALANTALAQPPETTLGTVDTSTVPQVPVVVESTTTEQSAPEVSSTPTTTVETTTTDTTATSTASSSVASAPAPIIRKISVSYEQASDTEAIVTVKNTLNESPLWDGEIINIRFLNVTGGTLTGYCLTSYPQGVDQRVCAGNDPSTYHAFIGHQNYYNLYLGSEETAMLRYEGNPTGVAYDPKSIMGEGSGWDITF